MTAFLITRNHDRSLERTLRSVSGLAAEVVAADTGSTDGTVAVAERLGARVCPGKWADDFAAACNLALDRATGEWAFLLNPDEQLDPPGVPNLARAVTQPGAFAYHVRVQQQLRPDRRGYGTAGWEPRLFRRDPAVRYHRRLHPTFVTPLENLAAARGQVVARADATIHRHAYLSTPTPDKIAWTVRLLEAELQDRPGQLGRSSGWLPGSGSRPGTTPRPPGCSNGWSRWGGPGGTTRTGDSTRTSSARQPCPTSGRATCTSVGGTR